MNTSQAGHGHLSVKIKQNSMRLVHEQDQLSDGVYQISFLPERSAPCTIEVAFNEENPCKSSLDYY